MARPTMHPQAPTISERLADYVVDLRYEDIPPQVIERAKHQLAHLLGTAFHSHGLDGTQPVLRLASRLSGTDGECSIVGEPRRVKPLDAAFANSFLINRSGTADDYLLPQGAHPGIAAQPVAWAFGEATGASGRDLLAAIVVGYDVLARLCDPMLTWGLDVFRPATFVLEPFGAVAAAARVLKLTTEQTMHAFGHAGQVCTHRTQSDGIRTLHPLLARNGAMAALLADAGMPTSSSVFEGEHGVFRTYFSHDVSESIEAGLATLGREFAVAEARTKRPDVDPDDTIPRHPAVIPVELARRLMRTHTLAARQVAAVDVVLAEQRRVRETNRDDAALRPYADATTRQASLRFRIATVIADDGRGPNRFERPVDADLLAILDRIRLRFEPDRPLLYTGIELTTIDQTRHVVVDKGDLQEPPPSDWTDWLVQNGRPILAEPQLRRLIDLIGDLDRLSDVAELMECVVPEAGNITA